MQELEKLAALIAQEFLNCIDEAFDRLMEPETESETTTTQSEVEDVKPLTRVAGRG